MLGSFAIHLYFGLWLVNGETNVTLVTSFHNVIMLSSKIICFNRNMENHPRKPYNHNTTWLWSWLSNWMNYMLCLGALAWWIMGLFIDGAGEGSFIFWGTAENQRPAHTYRNSLERPHSVPMQSHLGSVVLCLISTCVVGFKVLRNFYANCGESVQPLQSVILIYQPCSRSRVAWTLTWLINLKMDINHILVISYGLAE